MSANHWRSYFVFSKKERTGILLLLFLILFIRFLPAFFTSASAPPDPELLAAFKRDINTLKATSKIEKSPFSPIPEAEKNNDRSIQFHIFDPNTSTVEELQNLGIPAKTAQTIERYRKKGGKFHKPEDLKRIYGLQQPLYERLLPYINIHEPASALSVGEKEFRLEKSPVKPSPMVIDINLSDTADWIQLPAIGNKLAERVIRFREKLGGFYSIQQIAEVYGLSDSAFRKIQPYLKMEVFQLQKLSLNRSSFEQLRSHPYIKSQIASAIIQYRRQHESFTNVENLKQIHLVTNETYVKLVPYLEL